VRTTRTWSPWRRSTLAMVRPYVASESTRRTDRALGITSSLSKARTGASALALKDLWLPFSGPVSGNRTQGRVPDPFGFAVP
jgi:hypothetical protein